MPKKSNTQDAAPAPASSDNEQTPAASASPQTTTPPQAATSGQPDGVDWEARFKGLQRKYNELYGEYQNLSGSQADSEAQVASLTKQLEEARSRLAALGEEKEALVEEYEAFKTRRERERTITQRYPALRPLVDSGVLRDDLPDEQLEQLSEQLQNQFLQTATRAASGATPPSPVRAPDGRFTGVDELRDWLMSHGPEAPDYKQYEQAYWSALEQGEND